MEKKSAEDYRFGRVIGEGSFSTVYLAKEVATNKEYAIKVCDKSTILREKKQEYVKREKSALQVLLSSPGIINLACTFQDRSKLFFVLTYAANGELLKYINRLGSLTVECTKFYSAELLLAIEEMHKKNIIHRDLKPENLLLSRDMHLMIADFGSSKILPEDYDYNEMQSEIENARRESEDGSDSETSNEERPASFRRRASFVGTAQYVSPEVLKGNASHPSTDLWSFACIIYQMLSGRPPFTGASEYLIFQKILNCNINFPTGFDENAKDLISKLLCLDPKDRLGSSDTKDSRYHSIRNHPFFEGINWSESLHKQKPPDMKLKKNDEDMKHEDFNITDDIEPGLGKLQIRRILQMELGSPESSSSLKVQSSSSSSSTIEKQLEEQQSNEWISFVDDNELILKFGVVNKRKKGRFTRRRMLVLTSKPRLMYIDPSTKIKKGEIPFDIHLTCEAKNFKIFWLHTPNRIYYLEDTQHHEALKWCEAINNAKQKYIKT